MAARDLPTAEDKADAVMRLQDEFDAAHAALSRAAEVLGERRTAGQGTGSGPLFPFVGDAIAFHIGKAREALWEATKKVAPQYLDAKRAVKEAR